MRPQTRTQREVEYLAQELPPLTEAQKKDARSMFKDYHPKKNFKRQDVRAYQVLTVCGGYQVVRTFHVWCVQDIVGNPAFTYVEVVQSWISANGVETIRALSRLATCFYCDYFNYNSELEFRVPKKGYTDPYHILPWRTWRGRRLLPIVRRNGYNASLFDYEACRAIQSVLRYGQKETVAKARRGDLFGLDLNFMESYWREVKMIMRHNYRPKDVRMWQDTIFMANALHLDTMSEKICMPKDLKKTHDEIAEKRRHQVDEEHRKAQISKNGAYQAFYNDLLRVVVQIGDIELRPLQCYEEFAEEGDKMHHCVEGYFTHRDCLILSARRNHKRVATVELALDNFAVKQCRGVCNKKPEEYEAICEGLEKNKNLFRRARR